MIVVHLDFTIRWQVISIPAVTIR